MSKGLVRYEGVNKNESKREQNMKQYAIGCTFFRRRLTVWISVWLLFPLVTLLLVAAPTYAVTPGRQPQQGTMQEGLPEVLTKVTATIEKKSLENVYSLGGKFAIDPETLIVGMDGKEVGIKKMLVPCDVEVSFTVENGIRMAKRIDIKRVANGASERLISERPQ